MNSLKLDQLFDEHRLEGTLYVSNLSGDKEFFHNFDRANTQFASASTFKVLNTLIALQEGILSDLNQVVKWNGSIDERFPEWSQDQNLRTAFQFSCVWFYQAIARTVGLDKYRNYIQQTGFGQLTEPCETDTFWLEGKLKISAIEQVCFLKKVYLRTLPFNEKSYQGLKEVMLAEKSDDYKMYGKTGWAARVKPQVGWFVGYVETLDDTWFFATNIKIENEKQLPLRIELSRNALIQLNILKS